MVTFMHSAILCVYMCLLQRTYIFDNLEFTRVLHMLGNILSRKVLFSCQMNSANSFHLLFYYHKRITIFSLSWHILNCPLCFKTSTLHFTKSLKEKRKWPSFFYSSKANLEGGNYNSLFHWFCLSTSLIF